MKIYVIGTGGVGGYFGAKLAVAGNDVTFVAREENYKAIKTNGLKINSVDGDFIVKPDKVIEKISEIEDPELLFFTVKTYDSKEIAEQLKEVVNSNTVIITFQNGIQNDLEIKNLIPSADVYPGIAFIISTKVSPGVINQIGGLKRLVFGDRERKINTRLEEVLKIMKNASIDAVLSDDIERDLWKKFILINAFSGLTGKYRKNMGELIENKKLFEEYKKCVLESIDVARKLHINLPETIYEDIMKLTVNTNPESKSSLLVDIENGRRTEIATLNGTLVRLADEIGIDVPVNRSIYLSIKGQSVVGRI